MKITAASRSCHIQVARSHYYEAKGLLQEEQCGFRRDRLTTDMMFVVRRLHEVGRKTGVSLFMGFSDLQKAYVTVDHTLLCQVLTRINSTN